jgi:hypothetical protein
VALFPKEQAALAFKIVQESFILHAGLPGIAGKRHAFGNERTTNGRCHCSQHLAPAYRHYSALPRHLVLSITSPLTKLASTKLW